MGGSNIDFYEKVMRHRSQFKAARSLQERSDKNDYWRKKKEEKQQAAFSRRINSSSRKERLRFREEENNYKLVRWIPYSQFQKMRR